MTPLKYFLILQIVLFIGMSCQAQSETIPWRLDGSSLFKDEDYEFLESVGLGVELVEDDGMMTLRVNFVDATKAHALIFSALVYDCKDIELITAISNVGFSIDFRDYQRPPLIMFSMGHCVALIIKDGASKYSYRYTFLSGDK